MAPISVSPRAWKSSAYFQLLTSNCSSSSPRQFRVSLGKNAYHCFFCNAGGNILDFVAAMEGTDIRPAALLLVDWFHLQRTVVTKRARKNSLAPAGSPRRRKAPAKGAHR
jgi:hypothetical protein